MSIWIRSPSQYSQLLERQQTERGHGWLSIGASAVKNGSLHSPYASGFGHSVTAQYDQQYIKIYLKTMPGPYILWVNFQKGFVMEGGRNMM